MHILIAFVNVLRNNLDEAEGDVEPLELAADAENAALAVRKAAAVRQEGIVLHGPYAHRLAHRARDAGRDLLEVK